MGNARQKRKHQIQLYMIIVGAELKLSLGCWFSYK